MAYTILSARWANPNQTTIIAVTQEAGEVFYHPGRPDYAEAIAFPSIAAYVPPPVSEAELNDEVNKRIASRLPLWKQLSVIGRSVELMRIQLGLMRDAQGDLIAARPLTTQEEAEERAIARIWDWTKQIRLKEEQLKATPGGIPQDYRDNAQWPSAP